MGFVADAIGGVADFVGDAVGGAVDFVSDNPWTLGLAAPFALPAIGAAGALGSGFTGLGSVGFNSALGGGLGAGLLEGIGGASALGGFGGAAAGAGLLGSGLSIGSSLLGGGTSGGGFLGGLGSLGNGLSTISNIGKLIQPALGIAGQFKSANNAGDAAAQASAFQTQAALAQMNEANKRYDQVRSDLAPYRDAGPYAQYQMGSLVGKNGYDEWVSSIDAILNGPLGKQLIGVGEDAILQNAAATGGLRGGNVQDLLARHREQQAMNLLGQQYDRLAGFANSGQNAALGLGNFGQNTGTQVINALGQQGAAQAGNALAQGKVDNSLLNNLANAGGLLGTFLGG